VWGTAPSVQAVERCAAEARIVYWAWTVVCGTSVLLADRILITTIANQGVDYFYAMNVISNGLWALLVGDYTLGLVRERP
jgi:hypothetical protein